MNTEQTIFQDKFFWLALLVGGFFLSLTLWFGFTMDQAVCNYVARAWRDFHKPPYTGVWDQSFLGIFLVHRFIITVFGESYLGFRLFDFLVQLGSLAMIFYLAKKFSGSSVAGFLAGASWGIYYFGLGSLETGEREGYVLFILLVSVILGLNWQAKFWRRAIAAGLLIGFAFQLKPSFLLSWPVFGVWFLAEGFSKRPRLVWLEMVLFSAACVAPTASVLFYYWRLGALKELYLATIWFNFAVYASTSYNAFPDTPVWKMALMIIHSNFLQAPVAWFSACVAMLVPYRIAKDTASKKILWVSLGLVSVGLVSFISQGKFFPYHLTPFFGFLMIFSGAGLNWLGSLLEKSAGGGKSKFLPAFFYLAVIIFMISEINPQLMNFASQYAFGNFDRAYSSGSSFDKFFYRAAKSLQPALKDEDEIGFFSWNPLLPYLLQKRLPSRFMCLQHLLMRQRNGELTGQQRKWIKEYSDDSIRARPRFFLVTDYMPGWDIFNLKSSSFKKAMAENFPELKEFLEQNYTLRAKMGELEIYELSRPAP